MNAKIQKMLKRRMTNIMCENNYKIQKMLKRRRRMRNLLALGVKKNMNAKNVEIR